MFVESKQRQWQAFRKRLGQDHGPEAFSDVVEAVVEFLSPLMAPTQSMESAGRWLVLFRKTISSRRCCSAFSTFTVSIQPGTV